MKKYPFIITIIALCILLGGSSFTTYEVEAPFPAKIWKDYKNWYKPAGDAPITGDETRFLGGMHQGKEGYRVVYINPIGEIANKGEAPYEYPIGTIVVKEQYKDKKSYEAGRKPAIKIMVKLKKGVSPNTNDWGFVTGFNKRKIHAGESKKAIFCGGCHAGASLKAYDFVFVNATSFPPQ